MSGVVWDKVNLRVGCNLFIYSNISCNSFVVPLNILIISSTNLLNMRNADLSFLPYFIPKSMINLSSILAKYMLTNEGAG